tara:strand:+ start:983 stop:1285 length:303 start_codon:yes stop_codon:yes gene_type:complete
MDEASRQRAYRTFLTMEAGKADVTAWPCAYVKRHGDDAPLLKMEEDDLIGALDTETPSPSVRWLMHQLKTYDCTKQRLLVLVFDRATVLSDVLRVPKRSE